MSEGGGRTKDPRNKPSGPGKAEQAQTDQTPSPAPAGAEGQLAPGAGPQVGSAAAEAAKAPQGWGRYLVAPRPLGLLPGSVPPIEAQVLWTLLGEDTDVRVLGHIRPSRSRGLGAIAEPAPACPPIAVCAMPPERARALATNPQVVVEADQPLVYPTASSLVAAVPAADPALAVALAEPATMTVRVTGSDKEPVAGAHVWAIGATAPAHAITDTAGVAILSLPADTPETVQAVHVQPVGGYWPARLTGGALPANGQAETAVTVRALADTFEDFPSRPLTGWGQQAMRLTQLPPTFRGHGTHIALLDAGIAADHPDLKDTVADGHDFTTGSAQGWENDATGQGTRCAGVIAAADNHTGITGIAADTRLHALKLYPHGRVSHLLEALDWCITHDIDVAQINLACQVPSQLVAWKILDTRTAGTTCVAPAGDTGTTPTFPASLPTVIAVGAVGHTGTRPDEPRPAHGAWPGPYLPATSPAGVDLIAPGEAVITTSPDGDYTPADGTAIAAAHLTGLAALLLAHHDQLRAQAHPRTPARPDHLATLLRAGTRPVPGTDPLRAGAGLPDAPTTLQLPTTTWPTAALIQDAAASGPQYAHPRA